MGRPVHRRDTRTPEKRQSCVIIASNFAFYPFFRRIRHMNRDNERLIPFELSPGMFDDVIEDNRNTNTERLFYAMLYFLAFACIRLIPFNLNSSPKHSSIHANLRTMVWNPEFAVRAPLPAFLPVNGSTLNNLPIASSACRLSSHFLSSISNFGSSLLQFSQTLHGPDVHICVGSAPTISAPAETGVGLSTHSSPLLFQTTLRPIWEWNKFSSKSISPFSIRCAVSKSQTCFI